MANHNTGTTKLVEMEAGRLLFAQDCIFTTGAASIAGLPPADLPETAFAGRSNVGKSSLINALTGRHTLARTSRTPGRTRQLNFFSLGGRLMIADLPGYGYAKASKAEADSWSQLIKAYLGGRPGLVRCCLLVDARHGLKPCDLTMMGLMDRTGVVYQIVVTKADKTNTEDLAQSVCEIGDTLPQHAAAHPDIIVTSARDGRGLGELRTALAALAGSVSIR